MKHKTKHILSIALTCAISVSALAGCNLELNFEGTKECPYSLPDYSSTSYEFVLGGYEPPAGWVTQNKVEYPIGDGTSYHTYEGYKQFADLGLNHMMAGHVYKTWLKPEETWETSELKANCDEAYRAGVKTMYIEDKGISQYSNIGGKLVNPENGIFKTEEELDAYVTSRLEQYIHEPYIVGINITDEPGYTEAPDTTALSRSVRRCATALGYPDFEAFINCYQLVADAAQMPFAEPGSWTDVREMYRDYLKTFFVDTNCTKISVDDYPYTPNGIHQGFYATLQEVRNIANEYDLEMAFYADSFNILRSGKDKFFRAISQPELYHNFNSLLAFGVTQIMYFVYAPFPIGYNDGTNKETFYDVSCFVDRENRPTDLYYYAQQMFREYQGEFSNVYMNYKHQGTKFYFGDVPQLAGVNTYLGNIVDSATNTSMEFINTYNPNILKEVTVDSELALVSEFKDEKNSLTMFEVMNPQDPYFTEYGRTDMNITLDFGSEYEWVAEYDRGELTYVKLDAGKYTKTLSAGYATYVIPLK